MHDPYNYSNNAGMMDGQHQFQNDGMTGGMNQGMPIAGSYLRGMD